MVKVELIEVGKNMEYKIIIQGRLPGLNEYIDACRSNRYVGAKMKEKTEELIGYYLLKLRNLKLQRFTVKFLWYEKTANRDPDNIAFAKKFIFDALQKKEVIINDKWENVAGFTDEFYVDKNNPRVEVVLTVLEDENGEPKTKRKRLQRPDGVRSDKANVERATRARKKV